MMVIDYKAKLSSFLKHHYPSEPLPRYIVTDSQEQYHPLIQIAGISCTISVLNQYFSTSSCFQTQEEAEQDVSRFALQFFVSYLKAADDTEKLNSTLDTLYKDKESDHVDKALNPTSDIVSDKGKNYTFMLNKHCSKNKLVQSFEFNDSRQSGFNCILKIGDKTFASTRNFRKKKDAKEDVCKVILIYPLYLNLFSSHALNTN